MISWYNHRIHGDLRVEIAEGPDEAILGLPRHTPPGVTFLYYLHIKQSMVRKPGKMYREIKGMAYCRREYMGGVPALRIVRFDVGAKPDQFSEKLTLVVREQCQIRHTALEAARVAATRWMEKKAGSGNFHLKVRVYPHVVLREHKTATGAGADRISEGMSHAFGTPVGTAARVHPGYKIITIWTKPEFFDVAKHALIRAGHKLPTPTSIIRE